MSVAIARMDGQIALVQVVQTKASSHLSVFKYTFFGDRNFLANFTSSPPSCINHSDILQFLPANIKPQGDTLTLPNDVFSQFIACTTANQQAIEAKWEQAMRGGGISLR